MKYTRLLYDRVLCIEGYTMKPRCLGIYTPHSREQGDQGVESESLDLLNSLRSETPLYKYIASDATIGATGSV
jgi:hypothetical protein